ncbi:MAG: cysteine desulfurase [Ignavibacteriae bacterium]|nr:cysteine desulfurase [Ignavibacteriota bacterium]MCB9217372.1 cysteine desulfurase [Ignavibacteria bacterium]
MTDELSNQIRDDFPILAREIRGRRLVYLDNAATTQKPQQVLTAMQDYYQQHNANVHRGVHTLSQEATDLFEEARRQVARFINAKSDNEIVFVRGCTEGVNLVASTFGRTNVKEGDEVVISAMEHHSNIVPWQMLCEAAGATLRVIPMNERGELLLDQFKEMLNDRTKIVGVVHVSNSLGTINPVKEIIDIAHQRGIPVLLDGAQALAHEQVNVQELDVDFYTISGHKVFAPTGIGALYAKSSHLQAMPPYHGGGEMIRSVTFEKTTYAEPPAKFEAGTPNIGGAVALGAALKYVESLGLDRIAAREGELLQYGTERLSKVEGLRLIGTAEKKASILSFTLDYAHPHDVGTILDGEGVAVRTGHHCTQPVMQFFGVPATTRASLAFYNTKEDIDALVDALGKVKEIFG